QTDAPTYHAQRPFAADARPQRQLRFAQAEREHRTISYTQTLGLGFSQGYIGLGHALLHRFGARAVLLAAEPAVRRHHAPGSSVRRKGGRRLGPVDVHAGAVEQTHTRITRTQMTAYLILELVPGLGRVPARGPGEGNLLAILTGAGIAFHGEGKGAVQILGLARLMHADVGAHGGATTVAVRSTGQFLTLDAEAGVRRRFGNAGQARMHSGTGRGDLVETGPVDRLAEQGMAQCMQPAPTLADQHVRVVVTGLEYLEKALNAAFQTHQGTVAFGKTGGR